jgi:hypothetical protein
MKSLKQTILESEWGRPKGFKRADFKDGKFDGLLKIDLDARKKVKLPKANFFVVNDPYKKSLHLCQLGDLREGAMTNKKDSWEDFDARDILYSSNDLKDAVKWMLTNLYPDGVEEFDEDTNGELDKAKLKKVGAKFNNIYDNPDILNDFLNGDDNLDDDNFGWDFSDKELAEYFDDDDKYRS